MLFFLLNFGESSSCHNTFAEELLTGETLCNKLKFLVQNCYSMLMKVCGVKRNAVFILFSTEKKNSSCRNQRFCTAYSVMSMVKSTVWVELRANNRFIFPFVYISDDQDSLYRTRMAKVYLC